VSSRSLTLRNTHPGNENICTFALQWQLPYEPTKYPTTPRGAIWTQVPHLICGPPTRELPWALKGLHSKCDSDSIVYLAQFCSSRHMQKSVQMRAMLAPTRLSHRCRACRPTVGEEPSSHLAFFGPLGFLTILQMAATTG
jgi:hypothetical protein